MSYNYSLNNLRTNSPYYSLNNLNTENGLKNLAGEHPVETSVNGSTGTIYLYESSANLIDFAAFNKNLKVVSLIANTLSVSTLATSNLSVSNLIDTSGLIVRNNINTIGAVSVNGTIFSNNKYQLVNTEITTNSNDMFLNASGDSIYLRPNKSSLNQAIYDVSGRFTLPTLSVNSAIISNLSISSVTIPTINTNALFVNGNASVSGTLDLGNTLTGNYFKGTKLDLTSTANQRHIYQSSSNGENYFVAKLVTASNLEVVGNGLFYNKLSVASDAFMASGLSINGTIKLGPLGAYIAPETPASNNMKIYTPNSLYLSGGAAAAKDIVINQSGNLYTNDTFVNGNLSVFSGLNANTLSISSGNIANLSIGGNLRVSGSVSVASTLHTSNSLQVVNTKWTTNGNDVFINASGDTIYLRPNKDTSTNQATLNTNGGFVVPSISTSSVWCNGSVSIKNVSGSSGFLDFYQNNGTSRIVSIQPAFSDNVLSWFKASQSQLSMAMNDSSGMSMNGAYSFAASGYLYAPLIYPARGSAASPSFTFDYGSGSAQNTGLFSNPSKVLGFSTLGVERFRISNTGVITIGNNTTFYCGYNPQLDNTVTVLGVDCCKTGSITGSYNTAVGFESQKALTTGVYNTSVGAGALNSLTTGTSNTTMGLNAGRAITTGGANTAFGYGALNSDVSGINNTAIGYGVGFYNTRDFGISFGGGANALANNITGQYNVAVGVNAMGQDTVNSCNTAIGHNAYMYGRNSSDIAIGFECMPCYSDRYRGNSSNYNVGIGRATFYDLSGINIRYNCGIGGNNMPFMNAEGAVSNVAIGFGAGNGMRSGYNNSLFGVNAGQYITSGNHNLIMGYAAGGAHLTVGSANTFVGPYSGWNNTGNNNTFLGYGAGQCVGGGTSNASYNICVGLEAGKNLTNGSSNIIIGYAAETVSPSAAYRLQIGGQDGGIYGQGLYRNFGTGPVIFRGGVNNLDPTYTWDVSGNLRSNVARFTTETIDSLYAIGVKYQYRQDGSGAFRPYTQTRNRNITYSGSALWQLVLQDQITANNCDGFQQSPIWVFYASFTGSYRFSYGMSGTWSVPSFFHTDIYINGVSQTCIQYNTIANGGWYVSNSDSKIFQMNRGDQIQVRLQTNNGATVQAQNGATLEFLG
jgi:hypothetical protein